MREKMKYCVDYKRNFKYINDVDEIKINFRRTDASLLDFMLLHSNQRIIISIQDESDFIAYDCIKIFDAIAIKYPEINFTFLLGHCKENNVKELLQLLQENEIKHKYFFSDFVNNWDFLHGIMELNPSDVYLVEDMGFEIDKAAALLHGAGIKVRVFPNVAQSTWSGTPALKKFFIRPDDVDTYEPYVDVMEFFGKEDSIETYYKIYAIDKKWMGKLSEVILSFDNDTLDSRFILPQFAEYRIKCGKRCQKCKSCRICEAIEHLAATLEDKNIMIKKNK
jgi:hypothetical protein